MDNRIYPVSSYGQKLCECHYIQSVLFTHMFDQLVLHSAPIASPVYTITQMSER